jgi:hypothetical protein
LIQNFEAQLQRHILAVEAAVTERWSDGPVEGQVNRFKVINRQMCGRAGVELFRARLDSALPGRPADGVALGRACCRGTPAADCAIHSRAAIATRTHAVPEFGVQTSARPDT